MSVREIAKIHWIKKITTREAKTNDANKVRGFLF